MTAYATPKQLSYIRRLADERDMDPVARMTYINLSQNDLLIKPYAHKAIQNLLAMPVKGSAAPSSPASAPATGITCGKCKAKHPTVADVRDCFAGKRSGEPSPDTPAPTTNPYAELRALAEQLPNVKRGRYAIRNTADTGWLFYVVDKPTQGRWTGFTFVKRQASDDLLDIGIAHQISAVKEILEMGARESAITYGREIGACSMCGRTLTDPESIAAGIGPVCAEKAGW